VLPKSGKLVTGLSRSPDDLTGTPTPSKGHP
jgi:hypothetical protein